MLDVMCSESLQTGNGWKLHTARHHRKPGCTRNRRRHIGDPCRRYPKPELDLSLPYTIMVLGGCCQAYRSVGRGSVQELLTEVLPVLVARGVLDDNLLVVVRKLVNDVLVLLSELEVVEGSYALLGNGGSIGRKGGRMVSAMSQRIMEGASVLLYCPAAGVMVGRLCRGNTERGASAIKRGVRGGISVRTNPD